MEHYKFILKLPDHMTYAYEEDMRHLDESSLNHYEQYQDIDRELKITANQSKLQYHYDRKNGTYSKEVLNAVCEFMKFHPNKIVYRIVVEEEKNLMQFEEYNGQIEVWISNSIAKIKYEYRVHLYIE
jgi:hypothetical protein